MMKIDIIIITIAYFLPINKINNNKLMYGHLISNNKAPLKECNKTKLAISNLSKDKAEELGDIYFLLINVCKYIAKYFEQLSLFYFIKKML